MIRLRHGTEVDNARLYLSAWLRRKKGAPDLSALHRLLAGGMITCGLIMCIWACFMPVKAFVAQHLLAQAWTQTQKGAPTPPWPWADFTPQARLAFPAQGRSVIALSDASGEALAFGPTHMTASAPPGQRGVAIYAAHRDTHFNFLGALDKGDEIHVDTARDAHVFHVTGKQIVRWNASGVIPHDNGPPRLALVTCWPLDGRFQGPLRLIVWAKMNA